MSWVSQVEHGVEVSADVRRQLRRAHDAAAPRECCGVLLGERAAGAVVVRRVVETRNSATGIGAFAIPDEEMRRARVLATEWGLSIVAIFHSHPDGVGEPSANDRAALAHSEWPWAIVTVAAGADDVHVEWHAVPPAPPSRDCGC
jgi:proteasome lid subunit RPN8/RPN11